MPSKEHTMVKKSRRSVTKTLNQAMSTMVKKKKHRRNLDLDKDPESDDV
jgi:hypothetical protein